MGVVCHSVDILSGSTQLTNNNRLKIFRLTNVATAAGGAAGSPVTVTVTFPSAEWPLDGAGLPVYCAHATSNLVDAVVSCVKTAATVVVTLQPRLNTITLAAGVVDITLMG